MTTEVQRIAEGLTEAQRRLFASVRGNISEATDSLGRSIEYHHRHYPFRYDARRGATLGSISALYRRGLIPRASEWDGPHAVECGGIGWLTLTPLGLAVRTHLTGASTDD